MPCLEHWHFFAINLYFDFNTVVPEKKVAHTQISIFHKTQKLGAHLYSPKNERVIVDSKASDWLKENEPGKFRELPEKISKDILIYSLLGFLLTSESDWKQEVENFVSTTITITTTWERQAHGYHMVLSGQKPAQLRLACTKDTCVKGGLCHQ